MSTRNKFLIGFGVYVGVAIALYLIFGSDGKNDHFKPQNEFKLEPWIELKIGGLDLSFNKAVLYLLLTCILTIGTMVTSPGGWRRSPTARRRSSRAPTT